MTNVLKPIADLALKFLLNAHLLLILVFSIFYFVPGAYIDDEHFVEHSLSSVDSIQSVNILSKVLDSMHRIYSLDFGVSYQNRNARVLDLVWNKALFSIQYLGIAAGLVFFLAIFTSFLVVRSKKKKIFVSVFVGLNQIPQLVLVPSIIYLFAYNSNMVPLKFDAHNFVSVVFVIVTLALKPLSQLTHLTVEKWQKEFSEVYVQFAKGKGLGRDRILLVHTFKNVANSFLGYFLTVILHLLTGSFILESLYSIPGFGLGFMDSVSQRDLPLVIGYIFLFSGIYLTLHFIIQILFLYINPRLREAS